MKQIINPFGNDSTPNPSEQNESASLPERGTGIETGNAGERRQGNPRTEEERAERHFDKTNDNYETITGDGIIHQRLKGYERPEPSKPSMKAQWREWHKKHDK